MGKRFDTNGISISGIYAAINKDDNLSNLEKANERR